MHIQVKSTVKPTAFADEVEDDVPSVDYPLGQLAELLAILAEDRGAGDPGFNLASAAGHDIELGGEFAFWANPREGMNEDHESATLAAMDRLRTAGYDANTYHVQAKHIADTKGALLEFVSEVSGRGLHIVEINVGAPDREGVPIQIFTARPS
jgi:hypothetical protein